MTLAVLNLGLAAVVAAFVAYLLGAYAKRPAEALGRYALAAEIADVIAERLPALPEAEACDLACRVADQIGPVVEGAGERVA